MDELSVREIIARALAEDIGPGDITTAATVSPDSEGKAVIIAKQDFVLAGLEVFLEVFLTIDKGIDFSSGYDDGDFIKKGAVIAELSGPLAVLLTGERVALNILQRMCGVATETKKFVDAVAGTDAEILDTRKTMPGLRVLDKYAVSVGGGRNHRFGLFDGVLIKDNHIAAAGGIKYAVRTAKENAPHTLKIEVECESIEQVKEALAAGADIIMLDNMGIEAMKAAVKVIGGKAAVEASGNMTLKRVRAVAETGVDFISVGAITHSAPAVDISMKIKEPK
ncbi:MAG TPA: carboxylating nicotinate-nucleotide diphosphorylase [Nitrospirota bacterium]|jgi:nicotinate-nucleotide pyrophosphorylase (carboxylating)